MAKRKTSILRGYVWDPDSQRYRDSAGRYVARTRITALLERSINGRERRILDGAQALYDGKITPKVYAARTAELVKRQHLQNSALAAGGWDRLTPADYGRIGGNLRSEYKHLANLANGIADGTVSTAQAQNRLHMYMGNARKEFYQVERAHLPKPKAGMSRLERRQLNPADSCDDCIGYAAQGWQAEGVLPVPGEGSQCFPGSLLVMAEGIVKGFKREYIGDLVEITTSSGHKLSATPNHPIATPSGWVAISALHEGNQIICDLRAKLVTGTYPNIVNIPTPISEVFDALAFAGHVQRIPSSPVDFHGDGRHQEIHVVWADDCLPNRMKALCYESLPDLRFPHAYNGEMCTTCLMSSGDFSVHMGIQKLAGAAGGKPFFLKDSLDCMRGSAVSPAYATQGLPGSIGVGDLGTGKHGDSGFRTGFVDQNILSEPTDTDPCIEQSPTDSDSADAIPFGERKLGLAIDIPLDDLINWQSDPDFGVTSIVSAHRIPFAGCVYNLTTERHYYTTAGIIVKNCNGNCRCALDRKETPIADAGNMIGTGGATA